MIHLLLLSYALTVVLGTFSAVYAYQAYRALKLPYLRSVHIYAVIFLISVFCGQILEYAYINILKGSFRDIPPRTFGTWLLFLAVARLLMLYAIGQAFLRMKVLQRKRLFYAGFVFVSVLELAPLLLGFVLSLLFRPLPAQPPAMLPPPLLMGIMRNAPKVGEFFAAALIGGLFLSKGVKNGQRSFSLFGLSFTAWYAAQFIIDLALRPSAAYYANSVLLLPASAIPFLAIRYGVLREIGKSRGEDSRDLSGRLLESFNISPREEEIIHLILQGMSNKEIQEALFISHNTVKNHVYNIYQKMNIKSRLQLVSVVLNLSSPPDSVQ